MCKAPPLPRKKQKVYLILPKTKEWTLICKYPPNLVVGCLTACLDENTNTMYIYGCESTLATYNINTKEWNVYQVHKNGANMNNNQYAKLLSLEGKIRLIGVRQNYYHMIWNPEIKDFELLTQFDDTSNNKGVA